MTPGSDPAARLRERGYAVSDPPRTWTVELPPGIRLLNANQRLHWAARFRITHDIRWAAFVVARNAHIPPLERARVTVEYQPPKTTRRRDAGNWAPSGKAAVDGALRDTHVLTDDDSSRLVAEEYIIGEPHPRGRLVLHITEVVADGG